jgi:CheY-like chemotaxis protein
VLVVDDDELQLRGYRRLLSPEFEVVCASDGGEALGLIAQGLTVDAIISDLMMPGIDGVGLHHGLFRSAPELLSRLLFITGTPPEGRSRRFTRRVANPVMQKPAPPSELLRAVRLLAQGVPAFEIESVPPPSHHPLCCTG